MELPYIIGENALVPQEQERGEVGAPGSCGKFIFERQSQQRAGLLRTTEHRTVVQIRQRRKCGTLATGRRTGRSLPEVLAHARVRRGRKVRTPQGSVPDNVRDAGVKARGRPVPQKRYRLGYPWACLHWSRAEGRPGDERPELVRLAGCACRCESPAPG